jgi:hypothetical protein
MDFMCVQRIDIERAADAAAKSIVSRWEDLEAEAEQLAQLEQDQKAGLHHIYEGVRACILVELSDLASD